MNKFRYRIGEATQNHKTQWVEGKIQYVLGFEELVLQAISARAPLSGILNRICTALDCQIGNVISLISVAGEDAGGFAPLAREAALLGMHSFHCDRIFVQEEEMLGCLEMYCCVLRSPSSREMQWIERAKCLAAIAIKLTNEAHPQRSRDRRNNAPGEGPLPEGPVSMN
jgi:hypothetical protein